CQYWGAIHSRGRLGRAATAQLDSAIPVTPPNPPDRVRARPVLHLEEPAARLSAFRARGISSARSPLAGAAGALVAGHREVCRIYFLRRLAAAPRSREGRARLWACSRASSRVDRTLYPSACSMRARSLRSRFKTRLRSLPRGILEPNSLKIRG